MGMGVGQRCHIGGSAVKDLPKMEETWFQTLGQEDPLMEDTAVHSSILPRKIPQTEETGRIQFLISQRVDQD